MRHSFLQLSCAAALATLAMSVQAQYTRPPAAGSPMAGSPTAPSTSTASPVTADADYAAALATCKGLVGAQKADCIRDAKADYDRRVNQLPSGTAAAGGAGHAVAPAQGVKRN